MFARFSIIVAVDDNGGIARNGEIPWTNKQDTIFFRDTTTGSGNNVIIMGRKTYESLPIEVRPLQKRHNIVISKSWNQTDHTEVVVQPSLTDALASLANSRKQFDKVFICGGEQLYREAIERFLYLCDKIFVTRFKSNYECDQFFPLDSVKNFPEAQDKVITRDYIRYFYAPKVYHQENEYLNLLRHVRENGVDRKERTGVGTISLFGAKVNGTSLSMEFTLDTGYIPILTTKKMNLTAIVAEVLWIVSGSTNTLKLKEQGVKIWDENSSRNFLDGRGLKNYEVGDIGPGYGFQLRHWGAQYVDFKTDYTGQGIDQLEKVIDMLKNDPWSRRIIISYWNVADLDKMALPPCHDFVQFEVSNDGKYLDCQLHQRSCDLFLGIPFNIAFYSLLTCMLAHITNLTPRRFVLVPGDAHIYKNHISLVETQLNRTPYPFPRLRFANPERIRHLEEFNISNILIDGYESHPFLAGKMAV